MDVRNLDDSYLPSCLTYAQKSYRALFGVPSAAINPFKNDNFKNVHAGLALPCRLCETSHPAVPTRLSASCPSSSRRQPMVAI